MQQICSKNVLKMRTEQSGFATVSFWNGGQRREKRPKPNEIATGTTAADIICSSNVVENGVFPMSLQYQSSYATGFVL